MNPGKKRTPDDNEAEMKKRRDLDQSGERLCLCVCLSARLITFELLPIKLIIIVTC